MKPFLQNVTHLARVILLGSAIIVAPVAVMAVTVEAAQAAYATLSPSSEQERGNA